MKIIETWINEEEINTWEYNNETKVKYTGNYRKVKNIFGKVKIQKEYYLYTRELNLITYEYFWNCNCKLYWKNINEK